MLNDLFYNGIEKIQGRNLKKFPEQFFSCPNNSNETGVSDTLFLI